MAMALTRPLPICSTQERSVTPITSEILKAPEMTAAIRKIELMTLSKYIW